MVVEVDTRLSRVAGLPSGVGLPPREDMPVILRSTGFSIAAVSAGEPGSLRALPPAGMPKLVRGSRQELRALRAYVAIDRSGSNDWTDPQGARHRDLAFVARGWAAQAIPDDVIVAVPFSDAATVLPGCTPDQVPEDGFASAPRPGNGGTLFAPAAEAIVADAARHPDCATLAVFLSDGLPGDELDVLRASALLSEHEIRAVLVPYGDEFPFLSAKWERTAFEVANHVSDRRRAIAQTIALAIVSSTGYRRADL